MNINNSSEKIPIMIRVPKQDRDIIVEKAREQRESISSYYVKSALMRAGILEDDR
jgi:uncharacterized protein (DUF1778 family)